ncbi:MAG: ankyrin repeat domain-containing protein [Francisellaceae bacterium]|jgi:uncharacterized protein|nr:ankyrin repeat domain-containing protein [Francisellaceae bacterium]MBT6537963.1 ankyrin repeat domain-containing protein [Francisellaceae bacterium]
MRLMVVLSKWGVALSFMFISSVATCLSSPQMQFKSKYKSMKKNTQIAKVIDKHQEQMDLQEDLFWSAWNEDIPLLTQLLNNGAQPNFSLPDGRTAIHFAVENSKPKAIEILAKHNANVNIKKSLSGDTLLHTASEVGCLSCLKVLVKLNVDENTLNFAGETPKVMAERMNSKEAIHFWKDYSDVK